MLARWPGGPAKPSMVCTVIELRGPGSAGASHTLTPNTPLPSSPALPGDPPGPGAARGRAWACYLCHNVPPGDQTARASSHFGWFVRVWRDLGCGGS